MDRVTGAAAKGDVRVAVIGMGKMGLLHASILNALPSVKVVAFCEKKWLVRHYAAKAFPGINVVSDLRELGTLGIDAAYITTPPGSHGPVLRALYDLRIANIFVEKPLASSYSEAEAICRLAREAKGINHVGYQKRFAITYRKASDLLAQDCVGKFRRFEASAYSSDFYGLKRSAAQSARGGVLNDLACHAIDLALWMIGDLEVQSASLDGRGENGSVDSADIMVKSAAGVEGRIRASWNIDGYRLPEISLKVEGSKGSLLVNEDMVKLMPDRGEPQVWFRHDLDDHVPFLLGEPEYTREDAEYIRAVKEGRSIEPGFEMASKVEKLLSEVEKRS